jgi:hypothetical protein
MDKKHEEIRDKVLKGTKRALEKLKEQSKKEGRILVVSDKKSIKQL